MPHEVILYSNRRSPPVLSGAFSVWLAQPDGGKCEVLAVAVAGRLALHPCVCEKCAGGMIPEDMGSRWTVTERSTGCAVVDHLPRHVAARALRNFHGNHTLVRAGLLEPLGAYSSRARAACVVYKKILERAARA